MPPVSFSQLGTLGDGGRGGGDGYLQLEESMPPQFSGHTDGICDSKFVWVAFLLQSSRGVPENMPLMAVTEPTFHEGRAWLNA